MREPAAGDFAAPVLLLHGQPGSAADWDRVRTLLGASRAAIAIDRPGWDGHSAPAGLCGNADAALAAIESTGAPRATVVGHSFGAAVAAWLGAFHPERVAALVLVAPAANCASLYRFDYWLAAPVAGYAVSAATLSGLGAALAAGPVRRRIGSQLGLDDRYLRAAGRRVLAPSAWRTYSVEQRALARELPALEDGLAQISAPTTIVAGTEDRIVPGHAVRKLSRQIPGAALRLLGGAGHMLPQREPERLARVIAEISRQASAQPRDPAPGPPE